MFILHSSRHIRPLFRESVTGHPANVVPDASQELLDCPAVSDAIRTEHEEAILQTNILASDSLPRWLTNQVLSDQRHDFPVLRSTFGWPRPESVVPSSSLNPSPCQLSILWDFVHFSGCGILSCGILSCGILSVGILSCGILSCGILSGYHISTHDQHTDVILDSKPMFSTPENTPNMVS